MAGPIRQPIDELSLSSYLKTTAPSITQPFTITQFSFGQSNPTYLLTSASSPDNNISPSPNPPHRYVLRKKPPGKLVSATVHKVDREYRVLTALSSIPSRPVPVPRPLCLCIDEQVIGTPFYIMEFLDGRIFEKCWMPDVTPGTRTAMWKEAVNVLARLHRVDVDKVGLRDFGKKGEFYERQVRTWEKICRAQAEVRDVETGEKVEELLYINELVRFFADRRNLPKDRWGLIHGDYKIDNLVYEKSRSKIIGILDWEMSTIGHPLSDLSNLFIKFSLSILPTIPAYDTNPLLAPLLATNSSASYESAFDFNITPGLPPLDQLVSWYAEASGYDPRDGGELEYGMAFGIFRFAAICHGIAARWARKQASSEKAKENGRMAAPLAALAWELVKRIEKVRRKL